jgi:hypothetical protein
MPGTANTEFRLGQQYWCVARRLSQPLLGTIVALTDAIGKSIGLEFTENIVGHSCDGRGKNGYCLWVTPLVIYDETEWGNVSGVLSAQKVFSHSLIGNSYETLVINPATGLPDITDYTSHEQTATQDTKDLIHASNE